LKQPSLAKMSNAVPYRVRPFHSISVIEERCREPCQKSSLSLLFGLIFLIGGILSAGCTTSVKTSYAASRQIELASCLAKLEHVSVTGDPGPFFRMRGGILIDRPILAESPSRVVEAAFNKAFSLHGGTRSGPAPDLQLTVEQFFLDYAVSGIIDASAEVVLFAELREKGRLIGSRRVTGRSSRQYGAVILPSTSHAMVSAAMNQALDEVLSARTWDSPVAAASTPATVTGTAFAVSRDGYLLTAHHVIAQAGRVEVATADGAWHHAVVVGTDVANDIALVKVSIGPLSALRIGEFRDTPIGTRVFTVGFPVPDLLGRDPVFAGGDVNSRSGLVGADSIFQLSIPIQPGNSGGPIVTESGDVIGLLTSSAAVASFVKRTGTVPQNVNWGVKIEYAAPLLRSHGVQLITTVEGGDAHRTTEQAVFMVRAHSQ